MSSRANRLISAGTLVAIGFSALLAGFPAPSAGANGLADKVAQARKKDQRAGDRVTAINGRLDQVNASLVANGAQIDFDRTAIQEQSGAVDSLEQTVTLASQALAAAQAQVDAGGGGTPADPTQGDGYLFNLEGISNVSVRKVVADAIANGGNVESTILGWQSSANDQVDAQLDLYRAVMWDLHSAGVTRVALIRRQRDLLDRVSTARQAQVETSQALAALQYKLTGVPPTAGGPVPAPVPGAGPFSICPVDPPRVVSDDFGDPRYAGGFHLHAGNDILAPRGTPIRAPFDGVAEDSTNGLGGIAVRVTGAAGYVYNAHLDQLGTLGQVRAGDVIGYVGNSGDAAGGPTHDHFEWHPVNTGGATTINGAVDPHPLLEAVCP